MVNPLMSKSVSYESKLEKRGNYSFYVGDIAKKCWLCAMGTDKVMEMGVGEAIEVVGNAVGSNKATRIDASQ